MNKVKNIEVEARITYPRQPWVSRILLQSSTFNIMDYLSFPAVDNRKHFFWYQIEYLKKHAQKQTK